MHQDRFAFLHALHESRLRFEQNICPDTTILYDPNEVHVQPHPSNRGFHTPDKSYSHERLLYLLLHPDAGTVVIYNSDRSLIYMTTTGEVEVQKDNRILILQPQTFVVPAKAVRLLEEYLEISDLHAFLEEQLHQ